MATKWKRDDFGYLVPAIPNPALDKAVVLPASTFQGVADIVDNDSVKTAAGIALVYHGYKRTGSLVWALVYGLAGKKLPALAVPVALAQGFGQKKSCP